MFGFIAAITRRIELVTGIIILPQRQTALRQDDDAVTSSMVRVIAAMNPNITNGSWNGSDASWSFPKVEGDDVLEALFLGGLRELADRAGVVGDCPVPAGGWFRSAWEASCHADARRGRRASAAHAAGQEREAGSQERPCLGKPTH